ncbi:type A chloramphenicol O-acetyltransferase [Brevibacillus sp. AF8]|uniref:type A chloramphenicol O-acetyltransferase n=1 Tax=Brevibacillus sp. AF8 TaxID=2825881 RepID=UPI001E5574A7|nr:type A chloramphenicol O-acetyltransferase [Brevibacillus sp. AF8]MCE0450004.1 type A chloramphenicol O-acetyltransferase [Brevibacillus sp. AF8]
MKFQRIDLNNWSRKSYFEHYLNRVNCTFSLTANIDISGLLPALRQKGMKLYPAFLYMVTNVVNEHREFRTSFHADGELGYWESMIPSYTFFHKDDQTFSTMWTEFADEFPVFYQNYVADMKQYGDNKGFVAKEPEPPYTFPVSCIPWVSFSGFNLNISGDGRYLLPIITSGKYFEQGGKTLLPVSLQVHHAVCDGYHASLFINDLQKWATNYKEWLGVE